jgi:hypothetical protein
MTRAPSLSVIARQEAKAAERCSALTARFEQLKEAAPNADPADLKHIAIMCGTNPTFPTILRLLASK